MNILFHFVLVRLRNDDKKPIPFYLESYYADADEEEEEEEMPPEEDNTFQESTSEDTSDNKNS